ncbi:MFS transporter [Streptomyces sp. NPDC060194]|uniref:MFS transporter n=1 Tax=Streptomyces sp. NPDC060194 TaxID=3347069 RepID=UPI003656B3D5
MPSYRQLFRTPEFTPFFATHALQIAAQTVTGPALATLIYGHTGSPLLAALAMFGPSLAQLLGATTLLSAADRLPPRAAIGTLALVFALATALQAVHGMPVAAAFALLMVQGVLSAVGGGVRFGLLNEILGRDGYVLGRSVLNMSSGALQIGGFAVGGLLTALVEPRGTILVGAGLFVLAAVTARTGLTRREPRRTAGRASVGETWRTNRVLWSDPARRPVLLALWVPNGLVVGCESLFVPYAPGHSAVLFAAGAFGMLVGDTVMGRFVPAGLRDRLAAPLRLLLAAPYLLLVLEPGPLVAAGIAAVASVGFAASLPLQARLAVLTPDELSGHAQGLASSGTLAMQGVGAGLAGAVAQFSSPGTAMAVMAAASIAVTLLLAPRLRRQGRTESGAAGPRTGRTRVGGRA